MPKIWYIQYIQHTYEKVSARFCYRMFLSQTGKTCDILTCDLTTMKQEIIPSTLVMYHVYC